MDPAELDDVQGDLGRVVGCPEPMPRFTERSRSSTIVMVSQEQKAFYDKNVRTPSPSHNCEGKMQGTGNAVFTAVALNQKLLDGLRSEAWSGIQLQNGQSYNSCLRGRVYASQRIDQTDARDQRDLPSTTTSEPWPLEIEDHDGNWHEVNLKPGEVCYYESAKQYHARLQPMRGRAYASVFLHWFPAQNWNWTMWDGHVMVPPDFEATEASGFFRRRAVANAGPPPFLRHFEEYWRKRGRPSPSLPRGVENPVQEYEGFGAPSPTPEETHRLRLVNAAAARKHAQRGEYRGLHALLDRVAVDFWMMGMRTADRMKRRGAARRRLEAARRQGRRRVEDEVRPERRDIARDVHHEDHPAMRFLGELRKNPVALAGIAEPPSPGAVARQRSRLSRRNA